MSLAILCPGQGDQSLAMLALVPDHCPLLRQAEETIGRPIAALSPAELALNRHAQPAIAAAQLSLWQILAPDLPPPALFAGYSLGEVIAYGCAGAISSADCLSLAADRAVLMDRASTVSSGLIALRGPSLAEIDHDCAGLGLFPAIVNGPDRVVVGGDQKALARGREFWESRGAKVTPLAISLASHTPLLEKAVAPFADRLSSVVWHGFSAPVLRGLDGMAIYSAAEARSALARQLAQTLRWDLCLAAVAERGCKVALELGPGDGLSRMIRDQFPHIAARSVSEFRSCAGILRWVEGSL